MASAASFTVCVSEANIAIGGVGRRTGRENSGAKDWWWRRGWWRRWWCCWVPPWVWWVWLLLLTEEDGSGVGGVIELIPFVTTGWWRGLSGNPDCDCDRGRTGLSG